MTTGGDWLMNVGQLIRGERVKRYGAMERAAEAGQVDVRTWRRIEQGRPVRPGSYGAIDCAFGLEIGTTLAATSSTEGRAKLARDLVTTRPALDPQPRNELLDELRALRREIARLAEVVHGPVVKGSGDG